MNSFPTKKDNLAVVEVAEAAVVAAAASEVVLEVVLAAAVEAIRQRFDTEYVSPNCFLTSNNAGCCPENRCRSCYRQGR